MPTHRFLLILACSQRKRPDPGLLPALDRYDGGSFRVLRKAQREGYLPPNLDILILSAKFGLITSTSAIPEYDLRITPDIAAQLRPQVSAALGAHLSRTPYRAIFVNLGKTYQAALPDLSELAHAGAHVAFTAGPIGCQKAQLKQWLIAHSSNASQPERALP